jgi:hypothetical protein
MSNHQHGLLRGHLLCDFDGFACIAAVVADCKRDFFPIDTAGGIDLFDRHLHATPHLPAKRDVLAAHWPDDTNPNFGGGKRRKHRHRQQRTAGRNKESLHGPRTLVEFPLQIEGSSRSAGRGLAGP